ncbi:MAG: BamA/TamA family outer membrane protein [Bacteroidetes bacterium]|nr:BamA/TamA family outer membrane protein [Bacteroidota bacterium]
MIRTLLHTRPVPLGILLLCFALQAVLGVAPAAGQDTRAEVVQLFERLGESDPYATRPWPESVPRPGNHARWQDLLLTWYQSDARFGARIDAVRDEGDTLLVNVTTGPHVSLASVDIRTDGALGVPVEQLAARWEGRAASEEEISRLAAALLEQMTAEGYLGARVSVVHMTPGPSGLSVQMALHAGPPMRLEGVRLDGDDRTRQAAVLRSAQMRPGQALVAVDLASIRQRLSATGWFDQIGSPTWELSGDSLATLVIPVRPASPGQFDISVGSLPGSGGARNRWVGSGHLMLRNAFGAGRMAEVRVNRLPDQASSALLAFETPAPRQWPLVLEGRFEGYQQDSTFNRTQASGGILLRLDAFTHVGGSASWERTRAGQAGGQFQGNGIRIPDASARFAGLTFRYRRLEPGRQPRKGLEMSTRLERGVRTARTRGIVGIDTVAIRRSEPRERLAMQLAWWGANRGMFGLAVGGEGHMVRVRRADESELIPLGGATSLRGYDEDRFRGTAVGRAFVEARFYLDAGSRAFAFYDAGWVAVQAEQAESLSDAMLAAAGFHPGYGLGFVFSTAAGPVSLSWALNPEERLLDGRIHIALSFGL